MHWIENQEGRAFRETVRQTTAVKIVVADDDPDMRALIAMPLRAHGFQVVEKADGPDLLDYLGERILERHEFAGRNVRAPFVVVCDVRMPGRDGASIIEGMRQWGWSVPVIVISALDAGVVAERVKHLGVAAVFQKPFDPRSILNFVEQLVASGPRWD